MSFELLSPREQDVIRRCLTAASRGPYLNDDELEARIGIDRASIARLLMRWPNLGPFHGNTATVRAIARCLTEVGTRIRFFPGEWERWFDVPRTEVAALAERWTELAERAERHPLSPPGGSAPIVGS